MRILSILDRRGEHKGTLDMKKAAIFPITEGIAILGLEAGVTDGSTWDKMEALGDQSVIAPELYGNLKESFTFLMGLRLHLQLKALDKGRKPTTRVNPNLLPPHLEKRFRESLKVLAQFRRMLKDRYQVDFISR